MEQYLDKVHFFWFRRDLRIEDNVGLYNALKLGKKVIPVFIFDDSILEKLPKDDARVTFIYDTLNRLHDKLQALGKGLLIRKGNPLEVWNELANEFDIECVHFNEDFEPYGIRRDQEIELLLNTRSIASKKYLDHVIFRPGEIMKADGTPYTVFTPFKKVWLQRWLERKFQISAVNPDLNNLAESTYEFPELEAIGFAESHIKVGNYSAEESIIRNYADQRDKPSIRTTRIGVHLRFGTVSIRTIILSHGELSDTFLSELIWREFFIHILYHFPNPEKAFKKKYDLIPWVNNEQHFEAWCKGETGYPLVDAGMKELNATGFMHNRVRMVVASFLCKHLLIDWRWAEAYFAEKLLDFELASNNGNWQWAAGCGCDAVPYFRVFNPMTQHQKFDPDSSYVKKWLPDYDSVYYIPQIVEHKWAIKRAIDVYKSALN